MLTFSSLLLLFSSALSAQQAPDTSTYIVLASMTNNVNGEMVINAANPRPLEQAIRALRRQFGWTIDYEDPKYSGTELYKDGNSEFQVRGGRFHATIAEPATGSPGE